MGRTATFVHDRDAGVAGLSPSAPGRRERLAGLCARWRLLPLVRRLRAGLRHDLRILAYHRVASVIDENSFDFDVELLSADAAGFRAQMQHLRDHYTPLRFRDVLAAQDAGRALPRNGVVVTFDDGYDDNHDVAFPILRELGMPATFFVSTGHIDSGLPYAFDWVAHAIMAGRQGALALPLLGIEAELGASRSARRRLVALALDRLKALGGEQQQQAIAAVASACGVGPPQPHPYSRPMRWEQVRAMHEAGMEIGSHGVHHRMLAKLEDAEIEAELAGSRDAIARETGRVPETLAYPVGGRDAYDERVVRIARALGYRSACSYLPGINRLRAPDWFALRRIAVERETSHAMFSAQLAAPEIFGNRPRSGRS